jgi:hypothetical protein
MSLRRTTRKAPRTGSWRVNALTGLQLRQSYAIKPLSAVLKSAAVYMAIISAGIALAIWANVKSDQWHLNDWIALVYGTVLTLGITFLGRRQQRLQEAAANLELREKVGVIEAAGLRAATNTDQLWCLYLASDCRAALHLFPLANDAQQVDLLVAIARGFRSVYQSRVTDSLSDAAHDCVYYGVAALHEEMQQIVSSSNSAGLEAFEQIRRLQHYMANRRQPTDAPVPPPQ